VTIGYLSTLIRTAKYAPADTGQSLSRAVAVPGRRGCVDPPTDRLDSKEDALIHPPGPAGQKIGWTERSREVMEVRHRELYT
jgi:hypothetical protein